MGVYSRPREAFFGGVRPQGAALQAPPPRLQGVGGLTLAKNRGRGWGYPIGFRLV